MLIETREVDNPLYTEGLATYHAETGRLEQRKTTVTSNAMTRIGALCFIRPAPKGSRMPHHERAAEWFKSTYEACYGSGAPAVDPSKEPVDTSLTAHDAGMAEAIDRARELRDVETSLGKPRYDRLVALLVLGIPAGEGLHWRLRKEAVAQVLADLDQLAQARNFMAEAA